jgi:hypothetical protein
MADLGGDPALVNPLVPADLVIDHSVQVDRFGTEGAFAYNVEREYERNIERYQFELARRRVLLAGPHRRAPKNVMLFVELRGEARVWRDAGTVRPPKTAPLLARGILGGKARDGKK